MGQGIVQKTIKLLPIVMPLASAASIVTVSVVLWFGDAWYSSSLILTLLWLSVSLLLPLRFAFPAFGAGILLDIAFVQANHYKIALSGMPITSIDVHAILGNPALLWYLLDLPQWTRLLVAFLCIAALGVFLWRAARRTRVGIISLVLAGSAGGCFFWFTDKLPSDIDGHVSPADNRMWTADAAARLSRQIGSLPFLLYSYQLEKKSPAIYFSEAPTKQDPIPEEAYDDVTTGLGVKPNIVIMHLESIFNPNWAFNLDKRIESSLFERQAASKLLVPMRVNIVGGGSWVTEFEILTGLDSRIFGYAGYYSHVAVAPHIIGALPNYLRARGYRTSGYYPVRGDFFSARAAYLHYGFDQFLDNKDLALSQDWKPSDAEVAEAFARRFEPPQDSPTFSFVVTNGAHSPYRCVHFTAPEAYLARFEGDADALMNCELNEYILLMRESENAVRIVLQRLVETENRTGRPYVLLIYGDHQPHTFTRTSKWSDRDYDGVRKTPDKKQTFVHVFSSVPNWATKLDAEVPASLLPTIISSFVAKNGKDLYLPENLYLYRACGAELYPGIHSGGFARIGTETTEGTALDAPVPAQQAANTNAACVLAGRRSIRWLHQAGIVDW